jgi:ribosomal protein S18 acetylase RimI-like enzyme
MHVRPVEAGADTAALAAVLARAFDDDPVTRWIYARERTRPRWARRFFAWELERLAPQGASWTTDDLRGAALWCAPGQWRETPRESARLLVSTLPGMLRSLPRAVRGIARVEQCHPRGLHLYLAVVGVDPAHQRSGAGTALLAPGLERCDRERLPAYLETAREENLPFYERLGFTVAHEIGMPRGPTVWTMTRKPVS